MEKDETQAVLDLAAKRGGELGLPYFGAVTPAEAFTLLSALPLSRLVDVRTQPEWDYVGRVPGSALLEWQTYPSMTQNPHFMADLRELVPDLDTPVVFMCRSGVRSHSAAMMAAAAGYTRAFNLLEGFEGNKDQAGHRSTIGGWRAAGLPWIQS